MPNGKTSEAQRITSGTGNDDGYQGLSWTADDKLIYASSATGSLGAVVHRRQRQPPKTTHLRRASKR